MIRGIGLIVVVFLSAAAGAACRAEDSSGAKPEAPAKLRIVVFGAHCDDNELGAGGLMRMLAEQGHEVISAYATTFRGGRTCFGQPEDIVRRGESTESCKILGASAKFFDYAHEDLCGDEKTIQTVRKWLEQVKPDIVIAHWPLDTHPNHHVVGSLAWWCYTHEGRDVNPNSWNLYFYEVNTFTPSQELQSLHFRPDLYLDVTRVRNCKKLAIDCLKSQNPEVLWSVHDRMHVERGKECGAEYAEAFILTEAKPGCPLLPVPFLHRKNAAAAQ